MRLSFLGDVYLNKPYKGALELDQFVFNLPSPLSTDGTPAKGKINLGVEKPYVFETFEKFSITVNMANNSIMDKGSIKRLIIAIDIRSNILWLRQGRK